MMEPAVQRFETDHGARVYRIPMEVFPGFGGFAHLVMADGFRALVDCGSGLDASNEGLERGLSAVREAYGEKRLVTFGLLEATVVVIVHTERRTGTHIISLRKAEKYETRYYFEIAKDYFK